MDQTYVRAHRIEDDALDHYGTRGVVLSRDAASLALAALSRDAGELEHRGGEANLKGAQEQRALAKALNTALVES